ncbi:MAG: PTS transporter subunit EIIC [Megasphaera sp.]|jgi:PTS system sucrose-specific IIC component|nr:PTS transporter subunit EIIC [Megasphaera sp.]MCH4187685.1 PTS transporter subunit EIIC [Megasphaera sp.]MCH4217584.1 PTS transporter subunit EIIC [Megasphaera sp.]
MTNKELARALYDCIGPAENLEQVYNCMTRLRFHAKHESFTKEAIQSIPGVLGVNKSGDEWQIILGPGKATKVTQEFNALLHATAASEAPALQDLAEHASIGDGTALHEAIRKKNATPGKLILKKISHIFVPIIPAFIACGLITGLLNIACKLDPSLAAVPAIQMLSIAGNAAFWGLNLFVGINAAKEFGGSPILGGVMAAIISHPGLANITFLDEQLVPGRGGIIAVLLVVLFSSYLEKKLHRLIPDMFDLFLTPLLVVIISTFAALCICQPIGGFVSEAIGLAATESIGRGGAITGFILGGTFLPMVMFGVHQGLTPIHAELLSRYGVTILLPILAMAGGGQVGAAIAVYVKTKNRTLRKTIASALPVGIMGIGEPLIYGVTLPLGKPFIGACIGGACGGAVQAAYMVGAAALGISGLPLAASTDNISIYLLGLLTAYAGGFIATWCIGFDDPIDSN